MLRIVCFSVLAIAMLASLPLARAQDVRLEQLRTLQQTLDTLSSRRAALLGEGYLATSQRVQQIDEQIDEIKRQQKVLNAAPKGKPSPRPTRKPAPKPSPRPHSTPKPKH